MFTIKVRVNGKWVKYMEISDSELELVLDEYNAAPVPKALYGVHPVTGERGRVHRQDKNNGFIYRPRGI